jgi:hypothetical protein
VKGDGVPEDKHKAALLFETAARTGNAEAEAAYGNCLFNGVGLTKNRNEAFTWFKKAADAGNKDGEFSLGYCYAEGIGVARDLNESINWYKKAATGGHAEAQWFIGKCYRDGYKIAGTNIVQKDLVEAYKWLLLASQNGCSKADADLAKVRKHLSNSEISEAESRAKLETANENIQSVQ